MILAGKDDAKMKYVNFYTAKIYDLEKNIQLIVAWKLKFIKY